MRGDPMVGWTEDRRHGADDEERFFHGVLWSVPVVLAAWAIVAGFVVWVAFR